MNFPLRKAWADLVQPMFQRPKKVQVAALCYRETGADKEVLLVTSRDTRRWIIPKGWPINGKDSIGTALQEAWEEAGVREGLGAKTALGSYTYDKSYASGWSEKVETIVYPVAVTDMRDDFPEAEERNRKWVAPQVAANMVSEPELKNILNQF